MNESIFRAFGLPGEPLGAGPYGSGHIHDTYLSTFRVGERTDRYVHQRINREIFPDPRPLMENIRLVTGHLRESLTLLPGVDGKVWHVDDEGGVWRTYRFEEGVSHDTVDTPDLARQAARAFGAFQRGLADLDASCLHVTIPRFHDLQHRMDQMEAAMGEARTAPEEIAFARERAHWMTPPGLPVRVVHNDCKVNNVIIGEERDCVVDLDTVMPGLALHDFGDMVRTMTCPCPEDETDTEKVRMDIALFRAVAEGYLSEARHFLTPAETESLDMAGRYMTLVIGVRFLTDHLSGDVYFKTQREGQNLDRCRTQFALVRSMEEQAGEMTGILRSLSRG